MSCTQSLFPKCHRIRGKRETDRVTEEIEGRFGCNALRFLDPDGLQLELTGIPSNVEGSAAKPLR